MAYVLYAIFDAKGNHVGYVDGPFVLDRKRRVVAEVRAGVVVCIDGRVPGTFDAGSFLDAVSRVVAVVRRHLPVPRFPFGIDHRVRRRPLVTVPRRRAWSRLTWRRYMRVS
jgi:hypothetical protein